MATIKFKAKLEKIDSVNLIRLPKEESAKLPTRGLTLVEGTINGFAFKEALEPDGNKSHWLHVGAEMQKEAGLSEGDTANLEIDSTKDWPEPKIPTDLKSALDADPEASEIWMDITTLSRWDWIRWIRSTKNAETRKKRIDVTFSKLKAGKRSACCFNRSECTVPEVSQKGKLIDPS